MRILPGVIAILLSGMILSCVGPLTPALPQVEPGSRLHVYLQPLPQEARRLCVTLAEVAARRADGGLVPVWTAPLVLSAESQAGMQSKLFSAELPPGEYLGLEVKISGATLLGEAGKTDLLVPGDPLLIEEEFVIESRYSLALFLTLSPDRLVSSGYRLTPRFSLYKSKPALPGLKGFVSNTAAGTLSVFEKTTPQVVSVVALGDSPRDLVLDPQRRRVYVALEGEDAISAVDLVTETVQAEIGLHLGDAPFELALSPDGETLVSVNYGSESISLVDALSLFERHRVLLSSEPSSAFFGARGERVFVLHSTSNTLSVLEIDNPREVVSVRLQESPLRGVVSADGRHLYLLTQDSPDLLVVDAATLTVVDRKYVGYGALSLTVSQKNGLVYIGMASGEVVILDVRLGVPIDSFRVSGPVADMTIDTEENALYAVLPHLNRLEKFDLVSKRNLGGLDIGPGGHAVVVMGEE